MLFISRSHIIFAISAKKVTALFLFFGCSLQRKKSKEKKKKGFNLSYMPHVLALHFSFALLLKNRKSKDMIKCFEKRTILHFSTFSLPSLFFLFSFPLLFSCLSLSFPLKTATFRLEIFAKNDKA